MKVGKIRISDTLISVMIGIMFILFAAVVALSPGTRLDFLNVAILAMFGFVGYWVLLPILVILGLYFIFKKLISKGKFNVSIWGLVVIFIGLLILITNLGLEGRSITLDDGTILTFAITGEPIQSVADSSVYYGSFVNFKSSISYFNKIIATFVDESGKAGWNYPNLQYEVATGGGVIGYFITGVFNSLITPLGSIIASSVIMFVGLLLVFHNQVKAFFKFLGRKAKDRKDNKKKSKDETSLLEQSLAEAPKEKYNQFLIEEEKEEEPIENLEINDDVNNDDIQTLKVTAFNNMNKLHKPSVFNNDEPSLLDVNNPVDDSYLNFNYSPFSTGLESNDSFDEEKEEVKTDSIFENKSEPIVSQEEVDEPIYEEPIKETIGTDFNETKVLNESEPTDILSNDEEMAEEEPEIIPEPKVIEKPIIKPVEVKPEPKPQPKPEPKPEPIDTLYGQPKAKPYKYTLPPLDLLKAREKEEDLVANESSCEERTNKLNQIFQDLNIGARVTGHTIGPSVTRFNIEMDSNKSVSNVAKYVQDIQVRMGGIPVRFEEVVLGSNYSGMEISNKIRTTVGLRECIETLPSISVKTRYMIPFGKDINGEVISADVTKFPHMLVAGTTGSGKSIFIHSMIISLLARNKPDELKLLLIDPKKVEMAKYKNLPHLLCPNVSEPRQAFVALKKLADEMDRRYDVFVEAGVSDIKDFNALMEEKGYEKLPVIMVFIDEYADLSETCKEVRGPVQRIAQKARAAGIHLVIATQRPSVNVIDGVIQSNISTRVALMVGKQVDSTVILGEGGAEKLLGYGDMIIDSPEVNKFLKPRVQGAFVESIEIIHFCDYIRNQLPPQYDPNFMNLEDDDDVDAYEDSTEPTKVDKDMEEDALYEVVKEDVMKREYCSISYIQRTYGVGFPKAGRFMAKLQKEGIVSNKQDSAKGSKVLIHASTEQSEQMGSIEQSELIPVDEEE